MSCRRTCDLVRLLACVAAAAATKRSDVAGEATKALFRAVRADDTASVHAAINDMKASKDAKKAMKHGRWETAVGFAVRSGSQRTAWLLLLNGADTRVANSEGESVLDAAAGAGLSSMVELMARSGENLVEPTAMAADGFHPLHRACWGHTANHTLVAKVLLAYGVPADILSRDGQTPLGQRDAAGRLRTSREATRALLESYLDDELETDPTHAQRAAKMRATLSPDVIRRRERIDYERKHGKPPPHASQQVPVQVPSTGGQHDQAEAEMSPAERRLKRSEEDFERIHRARRKGQPEAEERAKPGAKAVHEKHVAAAKEDGRTEAERAAEGAFAGEGEWFEALVRARRGPGRPAPQAAPRGAIPGIDRGGDHTGGGGADNGKDEI